MEQHFLERLIHHREEYRLSLSYSNLDDKEWIDASLEDLPILISRPHEPQFDPDLGPVIELKAFRAHRPCYQGSFVTELFPEQTEEELEIRITGNNPQNYSIFSSQRNVLLLDHGRENNHVQIFYKLSDNR